MRFCASEWGGLTSAHFLRALGGALLEAKLQVEFVELHLQLLRSHDRVPAHTTGQNWGSGRGRRKAVRSREAS
jgi:hypothetical protein